MEMECKRGRGKGLEEEKEEVNWKQIEELLKSEIIKCYKQEESIIITTMILIKLIN